MEHTVSNRSKEAWSKRGVHTLYLPSGMDVETKLPNILKLINSGRLEGDVQAFALELVTAADEDSAAASTTSREELGRLVDLQHHLVSAALVDPALSPEEVSEYVPDEDVVALFNVIMRSESVDLYSKPRTDGPADGSIDPAGSEDAQA